MASLIIPVSSFDTLCKIGRGGDYPLDGRYELTNDIDASGSKTRVGFDPIGTEEHPFTGTFEGNGYTISALFINRDRDDVAVGLFGVIGKEARIDGVNVAADYINGKDGVGGLVGVSYGRVENCGVSGSVHGHYEVGGLVGQNMGSIVDSRSSAEVGGKYALGGLVGECCNEGVISRCYSTGKVRGLDSVGGLLGKSWGSVTDSYSSGEVSGGFHTGGLVGENWGSVTNSYSSSEVIGTLGVGGLLGWSVGTISGSAVSQCYSIGKVTGKERIGGLIGDCACGVVSQCYSTGKVGGDRCVGGLIGYTMGIVGEKTIVPFSDKITDCYWDVVTSDTANSQGGQGRFTTKMQSNATYENWDFESVWQIDEGIGYPRLRCNAGKLAEVWPPTEPPKS